MEFKDKLENAAENHAKVMGDIPAINSIHAFKSGAEWLMGQTIADRLTEEEREKIREIFWQAAKDWIGIGDARGHCRTCIAIEQIFGEEMFENKECYGTDKD